MKSKEKYAVNSAMAACRLAQNACRSAQKACEAATKEVTLLKHRQDIYDKLYLNALREEVFSEFYRPWGYFISTICPTIIFITSLYSIATHLSKAKILVIIVALLLAMFNSSIKYLSLRKLSITSSIYFALAVIAVSLLLTIVLFLRNSTILATFTATIGVTFAFNAIILCRFKHYLKVHKLQFLFSDHN